MKQIVFLGLMLLSVLNMYGQTQNVDSLVNVLETQKLTNIDKFNLYEEICDLYYKANNAEKNIMYAFKGLALAEKENNKNKAVFFNRYIGYGYSDKLSYDTALVYCRKALDLAIKLKDEESELLVYMDFSAVYGNQGIIDSSMEYSLKALALAEKLGKKGEYCRTLGNIGSLYYLSENYEKAISAFEKLVKIAEEIGDFRTETKAYYDLGGIYRQISEYDKALEYTGKALEMADSTDYTIYRALCRQNLSKIYSKKDPKDLTKALNYAEESLQIARNLGSLMVIGASLNSLSIVYREQKRFIECKNTAMEGWKIDSLNYSMGRNHLLNLIISNMYLGYSDEAKTYLYKYIDYWSQHNSTNIQERTADMEVKYETEKKELRIASLEKERKLYVYLSIAGVLFVIALGIALQQKIKNARKEKELIATRSFLEGEMKERARIAQDLHDRLSGNLLAVKIELGSHAEALQKVRDKLDSCANDIRNAAHDLMPVSLQFGLKVALEDFAAQFPNVRFHFFGEEKRIDGRMEFVVYCCASELVNNSIKHSEAKNINLQLVQDEKHVTLTVSDDGVGFDEKAVSKGFGLKSIRDRVASCNGKMDISTSPGMGTETTIELKVES